MTATTTNNKITLKNNRKVKVFLFFLILTSIIWLLIELSKIYSSTAIFKVEYINLPKNKLMQEPPISVMEIAVEAPGFTLLSYKLRKRKLLLNLATVSKADRLYYVLPNRQLPNLNGQLSGDVKLVKILRDSIFIELGENISKKVPINLNLDLNFKLGYNLTNELSVSPDSVVISGPKKHIDSIQKIETVNNTKNEVYESFLENLQLVIPRADMNVHLSETNVKVAGDIDKFTEGSYKIPVVIINEPDGIHLNPFPKEIEVVFQVALSNFVKIDESSINIVFDFEEYKKDTLLKYLTPIVNQKSEYISSMRIIPDQVEFLIHKQ